MAHFARINENNVVVDVIVVSNNDCQDEYGNESEAIGVAFCKSLFGANTRWLQTSYNNKIRGKYAGLGDIYDEVNDVFASPIFPEAPLENLEAIPENDAFTLPDPVEAPPEEEPA